MQGACSLPGACAAVPLQGACGSPAPGQPAHRPASLLRCPWRRRLLPPPTGARAPWPPRLCLPCCSWTTLPRWPWGSATASPPSSSSPSRCGPGAGGVDAGVGAPAQAARAPPDPDAAPPACVVCRMGTSTCSQWRSRQSGGVACSPALHAPGRPAALPAPPHPRQARPASPQRLSRRRACCDGGVRLPGGPLSLSCTHFLTVFTLRLFGSPTAYFCIPQLAVPTIEAPRWPAAAPATRRPSTSCLDAPHPYL